MAGWIKMKLGMQVGLGPDHTVLDGDPGPPPLNGHSPPIFSRCLLWPNSWMTKMPLAMEVSLVLVGLRASGNLPVSYVLTGNLPVTYHQ